MKAPSRYRASMTAVNASFFRMSATRKALRIVEIIPRLLRLDDLTRAARGLDPLASGLRERVSVNGELLGQLAAPEDLDRDVLAGAEAGGAQAVEIDRRAVVELLL